MRFLTCALIALALAGPASAEVEQGKPEIRSMSALAFGPDGVLFVGDAKGGAVFAVQLGDTTPREVNEPLNIRDVETKIAARLGIRPTDVMVHDMAVNPVSQNVYLAVSRGRRDWNSAWKLPNELADADVLLRIDPAGEIGHVALDEVSFSQAALRNPVADGKEHRWKRGTNLRVDAITDLAYHKGTLYIAGLSNEEFASTMWRMPYPFGGETAATTLEIFHGAHGEFETHAPIRTFVPYEMNDEAHVLAAYLCTPFVDFEVEQLKDGQHVKGRTLAEFGSGNYPLDMIVYAKDGRDRLLVANSNLPLMIVKPEDIQAFEGELTKEPEGYTAGLRYEIRSGAGVQQLDLYNADHVLMLTRQAGGSLDLVSYPVRRL